MDDVEAEDCFEESLCPTISDITSDPPAGVLEDDAIVICMLDVACTLAELGCGLIEVLFEVLDSVLEHCCIHCDVY